MKCLFVFFLTVSAIQSAQMVRTMLLHGETKTIDSALNEKMFDALEKRKFKRFKKLFLGKHIPDINVTYCESWKDNFLAGIYYKARLHKAQYSLAGYTPLMHAASKGDIQLMQLLIDLGADVNAQTYLQYRALHAASSGGHTNIVELLIHYKADIDAQDHKGITALSVAMRWCDPDIVKLLIAAGSDLDIKDNGGESIHTILDRTHPEDTLLKAIEDGKKIYHEKARDQIQKYIITDLTSIVMNYLGESKADPQSPCPQHKKDACCSVM